MVVCVYATKANFYVCLILFCVNSFGVLVLWLLKGLYDLSES